MSNEQKCELCGELMPVGEEMFKYHGYSGPCPKEPTLRPHQLRVVIEKKDLNEKLEKLESFITGPRFSSVDPSEQSRLERQFLVMQLYNQVLSERVAVFSDA